MSFNFEPLTPTNALRRAALVFGDRVGVVDGDIRFTYAQFLERSLKFAGALRTLGVGVGERVGMLAGNTHVMLAAHYAVPFAGAVLVSLNTRITPADMTWILRHAGCTVLIYDDDYAEAAARVARELGPALRLVRAGGHEDELETLIAFAAPFDEPVRDEMGMLAINYTSGTTAQPKGVMVHHRGAALQALAMALHMRLDADSVYLWTLPMFHCNGWCFTWAVTMVGGVHLCLRKPESTAIWRHLRNSGVTHLCAAPTVLTSTIWDPEAANGPAPQPVHIATGGAPPTPALLERLAALGFGMTHLYGLTETFGPACICEWRSEWNPLSFEAQARLKARQGVGNVISNEPRVVDASGADVAPDGIALGEIAIRGNNVMLGYYRDAAATQAASPDGWFRTGDLGVRHPDGYIELRDRSKDIIISGGENISSVEVERALTSHGDVLEAAVVACADEKWGEVPVAFVTLKDGATAGEQALIEHVRATLARFKAPKRVIFDALPKTATGKVQKNLLRARLKERQAPET
ncbi:AMP-binding protein [Caballeronia sp. LZ043]|uniref:AMP-binding protein n=1 Tax=Caballeronia sp. LZ043 TaxID=3038569 RepID=UPI002856B882|nr:AMP-binding protein [Caballeronia sp. LZ043]MDR5823639.1 AMP-binding protein [Caballeronia sp. LZ043]